MKKCATDRMKMKKEWLNGSQRFITLYLSSAEHNLRLKKYSNVCYVVRQLCAIKIGVSFYKDMENPDISGIHKVHTIFHLLYHDDGDI
jgi:hypothetical protein